MRQRQDICISASLAIAAVRSVEEPIFDLECDVFYNKGTVQQVARGSSAQIESPQDATASAQGAQAEAWVRGAGSLWITP